MFASNKIFALAQIYYPDQCVRACVYVSNCVGPRDMNNDLAESEVGLLSNAKQNISILPNPIFRDTIYTIRLFVCLLGVLSQKPV